MKEELIVEILLSDDSSKDAAARLGLSQSTVCNIRNGKKYSTVRPELPRKVAGQRGPYNIRHRVRPQTGPQTRPRVQVLTRRLSAIWTAKTGPRRFMRIPVVNLADGPPGTWKLGPNGIPIPADEIAAESRSTIAPIRVKSRPILNNNNDKAFTWATPPMVKFILLAPLKDRPLAKRLNTTPARISRIRRGITHARIHPEIPRKQTRPKRPPLDEELVREILTSPEGQNEIARRLGYSTSVIWHIRHGRTHQDCAPELPRLSKTHKGDEHGRTSSDQ